MGYRYNYNRNEAGPILCMIDFMYQKMAGKDPAILKFNLLWQEAPLLKVLRVHYIKRIDFLHKEKDDLEHQIGNG